MIMVRYPTKRDKRRQPFQPKCVCLVLNIKFFELTKKCITTSCTTRESYWSDIWNSFTSLQLERGSGDDWMEKWLILLKMFHIQKINSPESWENTPCMDKKINTKAVEQKLFKNNGSQLDRSSRVFLRYNFRDNFFFCE